MTRRQSDPVMAALARAPLEDEPISPAEERAVAVARRDIARGDVCSTEEMRRRIRSGPVPRDPSGPTTHVRTLRLCPADELRLERLASAMGVTASEAIRRSIAEALDYRLQPR